MTQTTDVALLAFKAWAVLQQHEAPITNTVMSACAEMVDVIGRLPGL